MTDVEVAYGLPVPVSDRCWAHIEGTGNAVALAAVLVLNSIEFTFDPYPEDVYEFTTKADQKGQLERALIELGL